MTFLQPFLLFAIAAAAIPLILHLLTLRRLPVIPFSTLSFLKELQRSRVRAVRLKQLLLLLLRTLLVLLIVLAFARPTVTDTVSPILGGTTTTDAIILIDDSYSMSQRDQNGSYARQASDAARAILAGMSDDDRVIVTPLSRVRSDEITSDASWRVPDEAITLTGPLTLSARHVSLEDGLRFAARAFSARTAVQKELFIISDLQSGLLGAGSSVASFLEESEESMDATFIRIGDTPEENMSISSLRLTSSIIDAGIPAVFDLRLSNHVSAAPRTANVSMFLRSQRLDQRVRTIASGQDMSLELQVIPEETGFQSGSIVLEGDETEFDNTAWFVLRIPRERRVLLLGTSEELFHASLALNTSRGSVPSGFRLTSIEPGRMTAAHIRDHDVFVLHDLPLRQDVARTLREQVEQGKGVILLPSSALHTRDGNSIAGILGARFEPLLSPDGTDRFMSFGRTDERHPLFQGMFSLSQADPSEQRRRIESPDIFSYAKIRPPTGSATIISLRNGDPFLSEWSIGSGIVVAFSSGLTTQQSTLPISGLFVPLLHRAATYASGASHTLLSFEPGEEITIPLPADKASGLHLRSPDNVRSPMQPAILPTGPVFRTTTADMPGVYTLLSDDEEIERFAVNLSPRESDPTPIDPDDLVSFAGSAGVDPSRVRILQNSDDLEENVVAARIGSELWTIVLLMALLVALAELWLSSTLRNDAAGPETL